MAIEMDETMLRNHFGDRLQQDVLLSNLTTARVGGCARFFLVAKTTTQLAGDTQYLWENGFPVVVLGSGTNVLVSDKGITAVVIHNKTNQVKINDGNSSSITADSGTNLASLARLAAQNSFTGLEWASTIPGTLGGAVYGNAGAHGGNMAGSLVLANILHRIKGHLSLSSEQMQYRYRSSVLKREPGDSVILSAQLAAVKGEEEKIRSKMEVNAIKRRESQPPGASMGSMFKNPQGDHAGRLIEEAGLKGTSIGGVQVSPIHGNFLINKGGATAQDFLTLISLVRTTVKDSFGIELELEIELLGNLQAGI